MPKGVGYARHYSLLKKLQIVIPPLEEQSRVITKLDKCYSEMKIFLEYLKKNKYNYFKLKSAILSKTLQIKTA